MAFYQNGKLEGERRTWYSNGCLTECGVYRDGKQENEFRSFYSDGSPWIQEFYQNGRLNGERKVWNENGVCTHQFYRDGIQETKN